MIVTIGLTRLKENAKDDLIRVCEILINLIESILKNTNDKSIRKLNLDSDLVENKLMPYSGSLEILFEIGFIEGDDHFFLPDNFDKKNLVMFLSELNSILSQNIQISCSLNPNSICASTIVSTRSEFGLKNQKNSIFAAKLNSSFDHMLIYEDLDLKQKCLSKIPLERLNSQAERNFQLYSQNNNDKQAFDFKDFLILELLSWFKNEFFIWVNQPDCANCHSNQSMSYYGIDRPNHHERTWLAKNIEVYRCSACTQLTRFPRYNHPGKLLDTRSGRCGEWANCFCLVLRSLDFDARYILDWTDHVWCEVYSQSQKRWLHADPCENTLDKPLLYEHGWNKKLSYVIAFSRYECLDVTWRYSAKHKEILNRRKECDEAWLVYYTNELTKKRRGLVDEYERQLRLLAEIVEFMTPKVAKEGEDIGRQSGSLQWRISRGEIQVVSEIKNDYKFLIDSNAFIIKYNTVQNLYLIENKDGSKKFSDWKQLTYSYSNIRHKIEHDWKMCYLEREKGPDSGFIEWYFNINNSNFTKINLKFDWSVFESGEVKLKLIALDKSEKNISELNLDSNKSYNSSQNLEYQILDNNYEIKKFNQDIYSLILRVELTKGSGANAFQHAQLFRQTLNDTNQYLFSIEFI